MNKDIVEGCVEVAVLPISGQVIDPVFDYPNAHHHDEGPHYGNYGNRCIAEEVENDENGESEVVRSPPLLNYTEWEKVPGVVLRRGYLVGGIGGVDVVRHPGSFQVNFQFNCPLSWWFLPPEVNLHDEKLMKKLHLAVFKWRQSIADWVEFFIGWGKNVGELPDATNQ